MSESRIPSEYGRDCLAMAPEKARQSHDATYFQDSIVHRSKWHHRCGVAALDLTLGSEG